MKAAPSLARQNTVMLAAAFVMIELLVIGLFAFWVLLPLGRRSADDLAGLMVLSAQTWAELPPDTRPAFEEELLKKHALALRAEPTSLPSDALYPPYFYLLEQALTQRTGQKIRLSSEAQDTGTWYWAPVVTGAGHLSVGLSATRVESQPVAAFFAALTLGLLFALGVAFWLARRLTQPLAQLEAASALIGQGGSPLQLPETGPKEMVALSRRFNLMAQQVRELLTARTTLLAGVSHDLRTPLARMRLALEILRDQPSPALIDRLEHDIEQMNRLIGHVLDLARGLAHEAAVVTDMVPFLTQVADDFSTPQRFITLVCSPCQCTVAAASLRRVVGNLLQNAQRYAPEGAIELVCTREAQRLCIAVLDRGPGIASNQIEAVFQPFHRLETSRSPLTGGSGLGLAIVRELARANAWQVSLSHRPGGGLQARVEIGLPP